MFTILKKTCTFGMCNSQTFANLMVLRIPTRLEGGGAEQTVGMPRQLLPLKNPKMNRFEALKDLKGICLCTVFSFILFLRA